MRAKEFIKESRKIAKPKKRHVNSSVGLFKFRDPGGYDRTYELNRVMMVAACSDGEVITNVDAESFAGRYNTAHPYTEIEQKMVSNALKFLNSDSVDLNHGDLRSMELDSTNKTSPIQSFKGFKK